MRYVVVGPGRVGTVLARLLREAGHEFLGAVGRTEESARACCEFAAAGRPVTDPAELVPDAELVLLTVPDDSIRDVCERIAETGAFSSQTVIVHCSGALPSSVLKPARDCGARVASMHPLQTFADPAQAVESIPGCYCCIEGDGDAVPSLCAVAESLGMKPLTVSADSKALYHAAAVMACNYLVALEDMACELMEKSGVARDQALPALLPLVQVTVHNLGALGIPDALTGPVARGDEETVQNHLRELAKSAPGLLPAYRELGRRAVDLSELKGSISDDAVRRLRELLK